ANLRVAVSFSPTASNAKGPVGSAGPCSGRGASCARDFGAAGYSPHASISVMRVQLASAWVTLMRIRSVGNGVNVTLRLTRLLPATVASVTQLVPLYPCTWK